MALNLATRAGRLSESLTLVITAKASQMTADGVDVINLSVGEPDFPTPPSIKRAGVEAIEEDFTRYTAGAGILPLRRAIAKKLERDNGLRYDVEQIVVTSGAKHALANTIMALVDPGDEVLYPTPGWLSYPEQVAVAGGEAVPYPCPARKHFRVDLEALADRITPKTKAIILNNPNNPTGAAYTPEEIRELGEFLAKQDLWILSDEIYEVLRYNGKQHLSMAAVDGLYDRTVTINGVSKSFAMTGWRIGYLAAPRELAAACSRIQSQMTSSTSSISQRAALRAIEHGAPETEQMIRAYAERRDLVVDELEAIPNVHCPRPEGAFYAFPDVSAWYGRSSDGYRVADSVSMCEYLLEAHHVALVPGAAFGADDHIRLSFASSPDNIREGIRRVAEGLRQLA